jgi:hypothetical protein
VNGGKVRVPNAVHPLSQSSQQVCASHSSQTAARAEHSPVAAPIERDVVQVRDVTGEWVQQRHVQVSERTMRFSELQRSIEGISQRMLS